MTVQADATPITPNAEPVVPVVSSPSPKSDTGSENHDDGADEQKPRRDGAQRAIDRQTRKYYEERAKRELLEKEVERLRGPSNGSANERPVQVDPNAEPDPDDFETPKEYTKALAKWSLREAAKDSSEEKSNRRAQEIDEAFGEREDAYRDASETYDDALDNLREGNVRFAKTAIELIQDIERGPALLEFLGNNLKEAKRIAALSPARQVAELARIEDKLPTVAQKPERKVSGAPEPVAPVRNRASVEKSRDELTDEEWVKRRRAEKAKRQ